MSEKPPMEHRGFVNGNTAPDELKKHLNAHPLYKHDAYKSPVQKVYLAIGIMRLQKSLDRANSDSDKSRIGIELAVLKELRRLGSTKKDH